MSSIYNGVVSLMHDKRIKFAVGFTTELARGKYPKVPDSTIEQVEYDVDLLVERGTPRENIRYYTDWASEFVYVLVVDPSAERTEEVTA